MLKYLYIAIFSCLVVQSHTVYAENITEFEIKSASLTDAVVSPVITLGLKPTINFNNNALLKSIRSDIDNAVNTESSFVFTGNRIEQQNERLNHCDVYGSRNCYKKISYQATDRSGKTNTQQEIIKTRDNRYLTTEDLSTNFVYGKDSRKIFKP